MAASAGIRAACTEEALAVERRAPSAKNKRARRARGKRETRRHRR